MSALQHADGGAARPSDPSTADEHRQEDPACRSSRVWLLGLIFFIVVFGFKSHKAPTVASGVFTPTDEFKLDTWFKLGPVAFNKGVLYLLLTRRSSRSG